MRLFVALLLLPALVLGTQQLRADENEQDFQSIFDGQSLDGWDGNPALWRVKEGVIVGQTTDESPIPSNEFLIWEGEVDDFVLRLEFRIDAAGQSNSGVQYRSTRRPEIGPWAAGGYQADIDGTNRYMGIFYEEKGRGILGLRGEDVILEPGEGKSATKKVVGKVGDAAEIVAGVRPGEWQEYEIRAIGNRFEHILNGQTTVRVVDNDHANAAKSGILALQLHAGKAMKVEFRNIRLKKVKQ
jgi:hypothetical protein